MNRLYTTCFFLLFLLNAAFAQQSELQNPSALQSAGELDFEPIRMEGLETARTTATCSADSNKYQWGKATGFTIIIWTDLNGAAQYFGNGVGLTVPGVNLYMALDTTAGVSIPITVKLVTAVNRRPTGAVLATANATLNNAGIGGTSVNGFKKYVAFPSPVSISGNYCVVVEWTDPAMPVRVLCNASGNGSGEDYSSHRENGTWASMLSAFSFDRDALLSPVTNITFTDASFTANPTCMPADSTIALDLTYPAITDNKFYSWYAQQLTPEKSHTWDYGNGITAKAFDHSYTYPAFGSYSITLHDTLSGWTRDCISPAVTFALGSPANANFTNVVNMNTVNFTSPVNSNNPTYAWDFGDGGTSTVANPTHTFSSGGTFTVCLTVTNVCGTGNYCENITITSVGVDPAHNTSIAIGPNPADNEIRISSEISLTEAVVELHDLRGSIVKQISVGSFIEGTTQTVDVNDVAPGVYFVKVKANETEAVQKIWIH